MGWKERFPLIQKLSLQMRNVSKEKNLLFLNITQFGGVLNDNLYKFLMVFLLIDTMGVGKSSQILFWTGTIYVLPFLLFASFAGYLADRFSKQRIIVILKAIEIVTTSLGLIAFATRNAIACYAVLFLLSAHSAFFGPPKFSIIPDLVKKESISRANGIISAFSYLAIIIGTFLASGVTQITNRNFIAAISVCILVAVIGFISSLGIPKTPGGNSKSYNFFFPYQIIRTLIYTKGIKHLFLVIHIGALFLFIGAYFQLNIIPYAIVSMGLSEIGGGYLFLTTAIGIAIGSVIAGKLSKKKAELGLSCVGGLGISILFMLLSFSSFHLYTALIILVFIGIFGGFFVVPLDSYVQEVSPSKKRGEIISANYFLSFIGVLMAPFCLYLISGILGLKAAHGFGIVGIFLLLIYFLTMYYISGYFYNFILRYSLLPFWKLNISQYPPMTKTPFSLLLPHPSALKCAILLVCDPNMHFYIPKKRRSFFDPMLKIFFPISFIYCKGNYEYALGYFLDGVKRSKKKERVSCFLFPHKIFQERSFAKNMISEFSQMEGHELFFANYKLLPLARKGKRGSRIETQLTLVLQHEIPESSMQF